MTFTSDIQQVVNQALADMTELHTQGKLANAPVTNNHFLVRWVSKAVKSRSYGQSVSQYLSQWQQMGRSKGSQLGLEREFRRISQFYAQFLPQGTGRAVLDSHIESLLDALEALGWCTSTSEQLTGVGKVQIFADSPNSIALCSFQCEACFDGDTLVKPMSLFVRGNHQQFLSHALELGLVLHKQTDYKSNVKYHGEYVIYPNNVGQQLAELPISYQVEI